MLGNRAGVEMVSESEVASIEGLCVFLQGHKRGRVSRSVSPRVSLSG